jgi:hypothetical protein
MIVHIPTLTPDEQVQSLLASAQVTARRTGQPVSVRFWLPGRKSGRWVLRTFDEDGFFVSDQDDPGPL